MANGTCFCNNKKTRTKKLNDFNDEKKTRNSIDTNNIVSLVYFFKPACMVLLYNSIWLNKSKNTSEENKSNICKLVMEF